MKFVVFGAGKDTYEVNDRSTGEVAVVTMQNVNLKWVLHFVNRFDSLKMVRAEINKAGGKA